MAIYKITYGSGSGSGGWTPGDLLYINALTASCYVLTVSGNDHPSSGTVIVSSSTAPVVGQSMTTFSLLWTGTILTSTVVTPIGDISLRNPGTKFDIKLQDVVAALIGAYWGVKVTVQ